MPPISSTAIAYPVFLPNKGPVLNQPQEFLLAQYSPYSRNMEFYNQLLQGRGGLSKFSTTQLSGAILTKGILKKFDGTRYEIFATTKDIYSYDFSNSRYDILTPIYSTGKVKITNGSAIVYGGFEVDNCDDATIQWADGSAGDVTPARTTVAGEFQEGTSGVKLTVAAGATVELLAYHDISAKDLHTYDSIGFWFKSTVALNAGDLQFLLDNTSACASPLETINFPAISANTWTWVPLTFVTPSALTAVTSIGIKQAVDKGAMTLYIDQIVAGDWLDQVKAGDFFKIGSTNINTAATWYTVLSIQNDTQLTLSAVYAGSSAYQQAYAIRQTFTGDNTDIWDWTQILDINLGETVVFTNGVDTPVYWSGSGQFIVMTSLSTDFASAKYVTTYKDRLIFLWTVEGGQNQPQRERWSGIADITSWDDEDFWDFVDEPTEIRGTAKFGGYHIVFKEQEAYVGRFVGGLYVFDYERSSQCEGTKSGPSIVTRKDYMYYYGNDNKFHRWNLVQDDIISETIFDETKQFDPNTELTIQGGLIQRRNQVRWFCPYGNTDKHNYVFVWDYKESIPQVWEYEQEDACCCFGDYLTDSDVYADDAIYGAEYADETSGFADDSTFLENSAVIIYGGYDGYVRIADSGIVDDGSDYTRILRFKRLNFDLISQRKRLESQTWWLESQTQGTATIKLRLDDKTSYESTTKTISLVPSDIRKDIMKINVIWNKHAQNFQPEISSTSHFALLGVMNYVFPKGYI